MKYTKNIAFILPMVVLTLLFAAPVDAKTKQVTERLVKCDSDRSVYLVQDNKTARVFPDPQTFYSYGYEFAKIDTMKCDPALPFKMLGEVPNKNGEGFRLIKKNGDPSVFQCAYKNSYKLCDKIPNEKEAIRLFGANWPKQVYETNESTLDMLVWHWKKPAALKTASTK